MGAARLAGKITTVDLGIGTTHGVVTADDGRTFKFGVFDVSISPNDWKIGLRVSFEEGSKSGEAKHVKLFSNDPAFGKTVVTVSVDAVKYVPYHYGGDSYADGVEVFYTYRVERGWENCSMEMALVESPGDSLDEKTPAPGHSDSGRSPNVSVFHPQSGVNNRTQDTPDLVCDGAKHSAKAVVGFGKYESVKIGAELSVRVSLRVTTGQPGNGVLEEAITEKTLTLADESKTPHQSQATADGPSGIDTSIGDWASTKPSR